MSRRNGDEEERKIGEGEVKPSLTPALTDEERNDKSSSRKTGFDGRRH